MRAGEHDRQLEALEGLHCLRTVVIRCIIEDYDRLLLPVLPFLLDTLV